MELGKYRRIMRMFWDPEPTNDVDADQPVWCLGRSYRLSDPPQASTSGSGLQYAYSDGGVVFDGFTGRKLGIVAVHQSAISEGSATAHSCSPTNPGTAPHVSTNESLVSSPAPCDEAPPTGWPKGFLLDFKSRFWMTYRSDFVPISKSHGPSADSAMSLPMRIRSHLGDMSYLTSDTGWGCMIRSGQGLLINAMAIVRLGRDWRMGEYSDERERRLVSLFADHPAAPYSIHNFVRHGAQVCGKSPGEWFGPSATASCIQSLANGHEKQLRVYSTGDGPDVYEDRFLEIALSGGEDFHPTLLLVGTRLGIDKVTPVYWDALIASLQLPQSVGIAGGRPSSSHYFIGTQNERLFYLDPHHTRQALPYHQDWTTYDEADIASVHTGRLRTIHVGEMDPSMLIGFLILTLEDWQDWRRAIKYVQGKPIVHVADRDPRLTEASDIRDSAINEVETISDEDPDL